MKKFLYLFLSFLVSFPIFGADSQWKLYPIFNEAVTHLVETPDYVYFTSRNIQENNDTEPFLSLFRYDKEGDEIIALSAANLLNGNSIRDIIYNPQKGYVAVLYDDYNIDLLHNDGNSVSNIPFYGMADVSASKKVHSMAIDPANNRLYLATDFGYVAVNDVKNEIAESRLYNETLQSFCSMGDRYLATKGNTLYSVPADSPRLSWNQFSPVISFTYPLFLYPIDQNVCVLAESNGTYKWIKKIVKEGEALKVENLFAGNVVNIENSKEGITFKSGNKVGRINKDGNLETIELPDQYAGSSVSTTNLSDIWIGEKWKGLSHIRKSGETWSVLSDWMLPNVPATYATTSFINHPDYGFLMLNSGYVPPTINLFSFSPLQLSGLKQGRWTNYAPAFTNPERATVVTASNGMVVEPDNPDLVYITSYHNGILRLNLKDPSDILHLSYSGDKDYGKEGFVVMPRPTTLPDYANISAPFFDAQGNLWMVFSDLDHSGDSKAHYYCWTAADRKASTSASNVRLPQAVEFTDAFLTTNNAVSVPLKKTGSGLILYGRSQFDDQIALIDTNNTPTDTSDDKIYTFSSFVDDDGNSIIIRCLKFFWEDPVTGYVWIGHDEGLCYFSPSDVLKGDYTMHRIKVSRNDGTNLADYLFDGTVVNQMVEDSQRRKWFALENGGVVCTSSDGREVLFEYDTSNSPLQSNNVFGIGYDNSTNSLMISTAKGYAQYSLGEAEKDNGKEEIRAYPNPVRPEFSGYVTITDIPQGSFVKITDVAGNLVKDLGIMPGFEILWDLSDSNFNRVKSGVYRIMVSPAGDTSDYKGVGKILVIS